MKKITLAVIATLTALAFAGTKMKIFYADGTTQLTPVSSIDSIAFVTTSTPQSGTVVIDNFERHGGDIAAQSSLGNQLGLVIDSENAYRGGGIWYSYTSYNGVKIYNEDSSYIVIDSAEDTPQNSNEDMAHLFRNDQLSFVIDYRSLEAGTEGESWAGIGLGIAGDFEWINETHGAEFRKYRPVWMSDSIEAITWDLRNLESISLKGEVQGPAKFTLKGVHIENVQYEIPVYLKDYGVIPSFEELIPFDITVSTNDLDNWDEIKDGFEGLEFQLVANESESESGDYLMLKLDYIELNFKDEQSALEAFPFLK